MKKYYSLLILLAFLFIGPVQAADRTPFLAVFANPGDTAFDWDKHNPDLLMTGGTWKDFDHFLLLAKKLARGRDIVVDVSSHGSPQDGYLWLDYNAYGRHFEYRTSVGHILNKIRQELPRTKVVLLEACYSSVCMDRSLYIDKPSQDEPYGNYSETYKYKSIPFPVYGIGRSPNYNNLVYLEYKNNIKTYFVDLRTVVNDGIEETPDDSYVNKVRFLWSALCLYGI